MPPDKPAAPAPAKPGSAPTDGSLPHSPIESRAPVAEKPAGEPPRSPVSPGQHPASAASVPGERVPPTQPQPLEAAAARPSAAPVGNPAEPAMAAAHAAQSAPAGSAPHLPMPDSSPPSAHPPQSPDGGFPSGHGGHQGPAEGSGPKDQMRGSAAGSRQPGDGLPGESGHPHSDDGPHQPHPSSDGAGPHPPGDGTPPEHESHHGSDASSGEAAVADGDFIGPYQLPAQELVTPPQMAHFSGQVELRTDLELVPSQPVVMEQPTFMRPLMKGQP
ncbi:hypothetical protein I552_9220 [Mycobacterium xenopi 3993]|nr:hypothetical protein I552_9220 [Mycobacterium xenopi 3993]